VVIRSLIFFLVHILNAVADNFCNKMTPKSVSEPNKRLNGTIFFTLLLTFYTFVKSICLKARSLLFAFYYTKIVEAIYNDKIDSFKNEIFADINTTIPSDRQNGLIRILEIGVGPGSNLDYFPRQCRLIAVDKNVHFKDKFLKNKRKHPGIILENFINECGENMSSVASNSIDVVVSSNIQCSVDNIQEVLKEIKRVLVPGGRYYFSEHVLDEADTVRYKWQIFINKIGLWQFIGHGCTFIDFEKEISKVDFFQYKSNRFVVPNNTWSYYLLYLLASHFGGCAIKVE